MSNNDDDIGEVVTASSCQSSSPATISSTTPSPDDTTILDDDKKQPTSLFLIDDNNINKKPKQKIACCCFSVFLLCFINAFNYVNRYTLPPVVGRLKMAFDLNDMQLGLIGTCFDLVYVATSPFFGYLGDRLNRRYILTAAILVSNASGLASSFVAEGHYVTLLITRSLLGMGEAAYSNIGPVIIADMFVGKMRTFVFALFQFAIPVGCGLGYIVASVVVDTFDDWRWAFRLTPLPIVITIFILFIFVREPRRGEAEQADDNELNSSSSISSNKKSSFLKDLSYILRIRSFTLTTLAFVLISFALGALCYWTPYTINIMFIMKSPNNESAESEIGMIFGLITILSGMAGVVGGALASSKWLKPRCGPAADGIVCGIGMLLAGPFVYVAIFCIQLNMMLVVWSTIFIGTAFLCCCWVLISEITMNVVIPTRRATAAGFMSAVSHLLGDALSPYLLGVISDSLRAVAIKNDQPGSTNIMADFISIQNALLFSPIVIIAAGGGFLMGSLFLNEDADKAKKQSHHQNNLIKHNP